jgi:hypothetical protein
MSILEIASTHWMVAAPPLESVSKPRSKYSEDGIDPDDHSAEMAAISSPAISCQHGMRGQTRAIPPNCS